MADDNRELLKRQLTQRAQQLDTRGLHMANKALGGPDMSGFYQDPIEAQRELVKMTVEENSAALDEKKERNKLIIQLSKRKGDQEALKTQNKDLDALNKYGRIMLGDERGATRVGKQWGKIEIVNRARTLMDDIRAGKVTFDHVSNTDYSGMFSGLITGRAPGIEMIKASQYSYLGGDINQWLSYISGNPKSAVSEAMMKEMENLIDGLEKSMKHDMSKHQVRLYNVYKSRLDRNPEENRRYKKALTNWADFDEDGDAIPKDFDDPAPYKNPQHGKQPRRTQLTPEQRKARIQELKSKRGN